MTAITIEGTPTELEALGTPTRWVAEGPWRELRVFVHAIAIPPPQRQIAHRAPDPAEVDDRTDTRPVAIGRQRR
jgi:hypothetical protein